MQQGRGFQIFRAAATMVALAVVLRLLVSADLGRSLALIRTTGPRLLLVLLPFLLGMTLDTLCWRTILRAVGAPVKFLPLWRVRIGVEALVLTMPGGTVAAEVLKPVLLARTQGVPIPTGAASVTVKKALYFCADAVYMTVGLVGGYGLLVALGGAMGGGPLPTLLPILVGTAAAVVGVMGIMLASALNRGVVAGKLLKLLARVPWIRFQRWIDARASGFLAVDASSRLFFAHGWRLVIPCFALLLGQWFCEALETFLIVRLLGVEAPFLPVLAFESLNSFVRSLAFFVPAGLGIQDMGQVLFVKAMGSTDAATLGAAVLLTKRSKDLVWSLVGYGLLARTRRPR